MIKLDKEQIKEYLPHREPMLMVDEVEIIETGNVTGRYKIKDDEFFCNGHFPGNPIVPGVIQCEIMAQTCAFAIKDLLKGKTTLYAGINNVRFKNIVRPGDLCEISAKLTNQRGNLFFFEATLSVDGKLCSKGELSFALV